jgi:formiminoglutamase
MLNHWLQPIQIEKIEGYTTLDAERFGRNIGLHTEGVALNLKSCHIALIGISNEETNAVRSALYSLSFHFPKLLITDLGNIRKQETSFIIPLLGELLAGGIIPIIIGHSEIFTLAQFQAFKSKKNTVIAALVDKKIQFTPTVKAESYFLHQILEDPHLFNCSIIGYQSHYTTPSVLDWFEGKNFELVRLGRIKGAMEELEPVIRDADMLSFNIGAIKMSDAPAQLDGSPSGFFSEEACQIARYAGMSDKMSSFGIYGYRKKLDKDGQTAQVMAQMIWYFIEGVHNRKGDFPITKAHNQLTQYVVAIKDIDTQVTFWRSNKSGRWWMEIPVKSKKKHERHRLIPCSYNDYLQACQEDLPDRLLNAYRRFK